MIGFKLEEAFLIDDGSVFVYLLVEVRDEIFVDLLRKSDQVLLGALLCLVYHILQVYHVLQELSLVALPHFWSIFLETVHMWLHAFKGINHLSNEADFIFNSKELPINGLQTVELTYKLSYISSCGS